MIPAYNEAGTIAKIVGMVVAALPAGVVREVVCVNDCSTDGTAGILDALPKSFPGVEFKILHKPVNEEGGRPCATGSSSPAATSCSCRTRTWSTTQPTTSN